jgi:hypothetical protein
MASISCSFDEKHITTKIMRLKGLAGALFDASMEGFWRFMGDTQQDARCFGTIND